jgi:Flp pilus assembly protein TadG
MDSIRSRKFDARSLAPQLTPVRMMNRQNTRRSGPPTRRGGVAASELAVCLPVLVLLVLAMIEACTMVFLKQSLTVAAYEGVRKALTFNANAADAIAAGEGVLHDRRVEGGQVTVNPVDIASLSPGEYIEVTVSAPTDENSVFPGSFLGGRTLTATAVMMKEF